MYQTEQGDVAANRAGASRGTNHRQLLDRQLLLSVIGGSLGDFGLVGRWLAAANRPDTIPRLREATIDGRVLLLLPR